MYDRYMSGGRYGIWGQNEAPMQMAPTVDPVQQAMKTAGGIQDLFGNYYKNKLAGLDTGLKQNQLNYSNQTLPGAIQAANVKSQADAQYYPLMQQANLSKTEADTKELMARTGMDYATAKMTLAHIPLLQAQTAHEKVLSDPMATFNAAYSDYNNAPVGSPQKEYLAGILNNFMSGGSLKTSRGTSGSSGSGMGSPMGGNTNGIQLNPIGGSSRSTFRQGYMDQNNADQPIDISGGGQTVESPTQQAATNEQMRKTAEAEIGKIYPTVMSGLKPYQGPGGSLSLIKDSILASSGNQDAKQRVNSYSLAKRFLPELASINARQATGREPGIELNREYENAMFPALPGSAANWFIPGSAQQMANQSYLPMQGSAVTSAINQERGGFPQSGAPIWANQPESQGGYFTGSGFIPRTEGGQPKQSKSGNTPQIQDSRALNGVEYVKINGKWHSR